jgi:hypothetical protein
MKSNYNFGRASLSNVDGGAANMGGREGSKSVRRGRRRLLLYERRWQPPLHGGNPLFMVVTSILILHDIHAN